MISLRQDFLDVAVADSDVWLSGLYLHLRGLPRHQSAVVTARGRGLYLTNMTFAGDNQLERGLHVMERSKVLVSGAFERLRTVPPRTAGYRNIPLRFGEFTGGIPQLGWVVTAA